MSFSAIVFPLLYVISYICRIIYAFSYFCLSYIYLFTSLFIYLFIYLRLHSLCIIPGGAEDFRGVLKFLEQNKGGYENCLNISWGMLILVRFCQAFVIVLKSEKRNDKQGL